MQEDKQVAFWNEKAETFPRYEEGDDNYEAGVLKKIKECGVDFRWKTVLDVGCGSGMYTLRIAREAERVTAVDISARMLQILHEDAERLGIDNIDYIVSSWDDFHRESTYDVVFCSMTPAIKSEESRLKVLQYANGWIVFMGFAGLMASDMLNGILEKYQIAPKVYNDGPEMREWLDNKGVTYASRILEGQWVKERGKKETIDDCMSYLMQYSVTPEMSFMEEYVEQFRGSNGDYIEKTDYKIELLVWKSSL